MIGPQPRGLFVGGNRVKRPVAAERIVWTDPDTPGMLTVSDDDQQATKLEHDGKSSPQTIADKMYPNGGGLIDVGQSLRRRAIRGA